MSALRSLKLVALAALASFVVACEEAPPPVVAPQPPAEPAPPEAPADPAPVTEGDTTLAYADGIKVLVKRIPGAEFTSTRLYIDGGVANWTPDQGGVERLALGVAATGGTASMPKEAFSRKLSSLGSDLAWDTGLDFSSLRARSLTVKWDETMAMLVDAFLHPALPDSEIEVWRARQLSTLRHEQDDPDQLLRFIVHKQVFAGHPYSNRSIGTTESVTKLDKTALEVHLAKLREKGRLLVVVAGDVDPAHVVETVTKALGSLPRGNYHRAPLPKLAFDKPKLDIENKKLPTNYIEATFPVPTWSDPDLGEAVVAMSILSHRLFEEVRTKRNLSYAVSAWTSPGPLVNTGGLYVTAVDPAATWKVMLDEVRSLQKEPVGDAELNGTKATYLTRFLMGHETTEGQSGFLASAELVGGDFRLAKGLPDRIRAVTAAGVQAFAKKYLEHFQLVVVGDPTKIDRKLFESL